MENRISLKRGLAVLLAAVLAFGILWMPSPARAAGMSMDIEFSPNELSGSGEVKITATIKNLGDDVTDATLTVGDRKIASWSSFISGSSDTVEYSYAMRESEIGSNIPVVLNYEHNGETGTVSKSIRIARKQANVRVSTAVTVDKSVVPDGSKVEFTFVVENQGDTAIEDCTITAPTLNSGRAVCEPFSVAAGDVRHVTYTGTIVKTINVEPTLRYTAAGKEYTAQMDSLKVTMSSASLSMSATAANTTVQEGEPASFRLTIKNDGNVDLKNLVVKDASGNTVSLGTSIIREGATLTAQVEDTLTASKSYSFTATCEDDSGETYTFQSNVMEITVEPKEEVDYAQDISLTVTTDQSAYEQTGKVVFHIVLMNNGENVFTDVTVSEETMGELGTYDVLMPGEKDIDTEAEIAENAVFKFKVTATDPEGNAVSVSSSDVPVVVKEEKSSTSGLGTAIWIVVIVFVLMVGAGVALVILVNKEKKNQKKLQPGGKAGAARPEMRRPRVERMEPSSPSSPAMASGFEQEQEESAPEQKGNFRDFGIEQSDDQGAPEAELPEEKEEDTYQQRPAMRRKVPPKVNPDEFEDRNNF